MKWILSCGNVGVLAMSLVGAVSVASANTVHYTATGFTGGGVNMTVNTGGQSDNSPVGEFIMTTSTPGFANPLLTYCTDVGTTLNLNFNYTPTPLSDANGVNPAWISGGIQNAATLWYNDHAAATTAVQTAGLQLAIWELLYNAVANSYSAATFANSGNGGFFITSSDAGTIAAENYAAGVLLNFGQLPAEQGVEWLAPTLPDGSIGGSQGLLYQTVNQVPEVASTLMLLGMAVMALGAVNHKLRLQKA